MIAAAKHEQYIRMASLRAEKYQQALEPLAKYPHQELSILEPGPVLTLFFPGTLEELRISNAVRSAGWIKTEYNNQSSPSTFYTVSSLISR